jgi:antitoxin component YwqK of YwqJK toxin-antitoxin module
MIWESFALQHSPETPANPAAGQNKSSEKPAQDELLKARNSQFQKLDQKLRASGHIGDCSIVGLENKQQTPGNSPVEPSSAGNLKTEVKVNANGTRAEVTRLTDGTVARRSLFAANGDIIEQSIFDEKGKPLSRLTRSGQTVYLQEYANGHLVSETIFESDGKSKRFETRYENGKAAHQIEYGTQNRVLRDTKLTAAGKIEWIDEFDTSAASNSRTSRTTYESGSKTRKEEFDASGKSIADTKYQYDKSGHYIGSIKTLPDGRTEQREVAPHDSIGFVRALTVRRKDGTVESRTEYGWDDDPKSNIHTLEARRWFPLKKVDFQEDGKRIEYSFSGGQIKSFVSIGKNDNPESKGIVRADGGQTVALLAPNGSTVICEIIFDRHGKKSHETHFTPDGKLKTQEVTFGTDNQPIRELTWTSDGKQLVSDISYDDKGNKSAMREYEHGKLSHFVSYRNGLPWNEINYSQECKKLAETWYFNGAKSQHTQYSADERVLYSLNYSNLPESLAKYAGSIPADVKERLIEESIEILKSRQSLPSYEKRNALRVVELLAPHVTADQLRSVTRLIDSEMATTRRTAEAHDQHGGSTASDNARAAGVVLLKIMAQGRTTDIRAIAFTEFCSRTWKQPADFDQKTLREGLSSFMKEFGSDLRSWDVLYHTGLKTDLQPPVAHLLKRCGAVGTDAEIAELADKAIKNYGLEAVRNILNRAAELNALPEALRAEFQRRFGAPDSQGASVAIAIDLRQLINQLANGTLAESNNRALLQDTGKKISDTAEAYAKKASELEEEAKNIQAVYERTLKRMGIQTREGVGFWGHAADVLPWGDATAAFDHRQKMDLKSLQFLQEDVQRRLTEAAMLKNAATTLNLAHDAGEYARLKGEGNVKEADLKALEMWRQYGDLLKERTPDLWRELNPNGAKSHNSEKTTWDRLKELKLVKADGATQLPFGKQEDLNTGLEALAKLEKAGPSAERDVLLREALRAIDNSPASLLMARLSENLVLNLSTLQEMFAAAQSGRLTDDFVKKAQGLAGQLKLAFALGEQHLDEFKALYKQLDDALKNTADREAWSAIYAKMRALEPFINMFDAKYADNHGLKTDAHGQIMHMIESIQNGDVLPSTISTWLAREGTVIVATVAVAAAAVATVGTGGAASPALLVATSALAAVGGFAGGEAAKEALFRLGVVPQSERSILGAALAGDSVYDPETGRYRNREAWRDTASPILLRIGTDFGIALATVGLGKIIGESVNGLFAAAGESRVLLIVERDLAEFQSMARKIEAVEGAAKTPAEKALVRKLLERYAHELNDQLAGTAKQELMQRAAEDMLPAAARGYNNVLTVAMLSLLAARAHVRGNHLEGTHGFVVEGEPGKPIDLKNLKRLLEVEGNRVVEKNGILEVTGCDGKQMLVGEEMLVKAALAAESTAPQLVEGKNGQAEPRREVEETRAPKKISPPESNQPIEELPPARRKELADAGYMTPVAREDVLQSYSRDGSLVTSKWTEDLTAKTNTDRYRLAEENFKDATIGLNRLSEELKIHKEDLLSRGGSRTLTERQQAVIDQYKQAKESFEKTPPNDLIAERQRQIQALLDRLAESAGLPPIKVELASPEELSGDRAAYSHGKVQLSRADLLNNNNTESLLKSALHEFAHDRHQRLALQLIADQLGIKHTYSQAEFDAFAQRASTEAGMPIPSERLKDVLEARKGLPLSAPETCIAKQMLQDWHKWNTEIAPALHQAEHNFSSAEEAYKSLYASNNNGAAMRLLNRMTNETEALKILGAGAESQDFRDLQGKLKECRENGASWDEKNASKVLKRLLRQNMHDLNGKLHELHEKYKNLAFEKESFGLESLLDHQLKKQDTVNTMPGHAKQAGSDSLQAANHTSLDTHANTNQLSDGFHKAFSNERIAKTIDALDNLPAFDDLYKGDRARLIPYFGAKERLMTALLEEAKATAKLIGVTSEKAFDYALDSARVADKSTPLGHAWQEYQAATRTPEYARYKDAAAKIAQESKKILDNAGKELNIPPAEIEVSGHIMPSTKAGYKPGHGKVYLNEELLPVDGQVTEPLLHELVHMEQDVLIIRALAQEKGIRGIPSAIQLAELAKLYSERTTFTPDEKFLRKVLEMPHPELTNGELDRARELADSFAGKQNPGPELEKLRREAAVISAKIQELSIGDPESFKKLQELRQEEQKIKQDMDKAYKAYRKPLHEQEAHDVSDRVREITTERMLSGNSPKQHRKAEQAPQTSETGKSLLKRLFGW